MLMFATKVRTFLNVNFLSQIQIISIKACVSSLWHVSQVLHLRNNTLDF